MSAHEAALQELDRYAKMAVRHSYDQYAKHGTLHQKAIEAFEDARVWEYRWVPDDFDLGEARNHWVYQQRFSEAQKLAWNHLQWGLDYTVVGQGERQIIVLNNYAVSGYQRVLPSVVELEKRESFEEIDHLQAFGLVLEGLRARYFPHRKGALWSKPASGFGNGSVNKLVRHAIGLAAQRMLGPNFPTLFFLTRGMKTHNFKPFENSIATYDEGHPGIKMISHLHRLDESRHMATSLNLAVHSNAVLDALPSESALLFRAAVNAAYPPGRQSDYRLSYWRDVLDEAVIFQDIAKEEREELFRHIADRVPANLEVLHHRQAFLTRNANKRIVEECGLSPEFKKIFVDMLRRDPAYRAIVDAVELPN